MKSVCSEVFGGLLLFSAVAFSDAALPMSIMKECIEQKTQKGSHVVITNIGIKMCLVRCIETGGCLRFEFDYDTLSFRLRLGDSRGREKRKGFKTHLKTHSDVNPGPCSSTPCSRGYRCLESRCGKHVCVKGQRTSHSSRSQQQRRDKKSGSGDSLLHGACREGDLRLVKAIMSKGQVDIDSREEEYGWTPVMLAARGGYRDVFTFLVRQGCNMSLLDNSDNNILDVAILGGHIKMVKHVLTKGLVNINSRGMHGKAPLMFAAVEGRKDVFDLILSVGGDASLVDANGNNILHLACNGGHVEIVKYVISQNFADINSRGNNGTTPLMVAATHGHRDVFDLVMSKGGDATLADEYGDNILHFAGNGGHIEMVKYVISQNFVDINSKGHHGRTPLMVAAIHGHRDVFELVMSQGGDATLVDKYGDNILHLACTGGHIEMVKHIISQNVVDINSKGHHGRTPLMVAAIHGHRDVFELVMSQGGDATLVDKYGDNILHLACTGGHIEMVKHIISQNVVDINSKGHHGRTPLMVAAIHGHRDVFDLVMSQGGDATLVDKYGDNILHLASNGGHIEMVKHIIFKTTVDVNAKDKYANKAATIAKKSNHKEIHDLLTSLG